MFTVFFFSSRRRHTRSLCDWSSDVCSSDLFNTQSLSDNTALLWTATVTVPPPTINVTPSSRSFGGVRVGGSEDLTFTVQNTGGGVVSGTATVGGPFLVVSGGSYSLSAGQRQRVTVRFSPSSAGTFSSNVTF